ncbi:MAG TPA: hypothetical protein VG032_07495 [Acidimicrobiales bacterium]|nr:hypothetical protein [Acidimicrobiales bacterium]
MEADLNAARRRYGHLSLWWDLLPGPIKIREGAPGDTSVDVGVVGDGYQLA